MHCPKLFIYFLKIYIYLFIHSFIYLFIFRERGREGEREEEKHQCVVASCASPAGDLAHNPGVCLTGNRTSNPLIRMLVLNPLSHTSQNCPLF